MVDDREFLLETERLRLRPYTFGDLDDLFEIVGDPQTMTYYPEPYSRDRTLGWIEDNVRRYEVDGFGLWAMELRETGGFVGDCGPAVREVDRQREVEIGWHVNRAWWNRGLATEAAAACREYCFDVLDLERVISLIRPENLPSRRVAEKIGMIVEREVDWHGYRHLVYAAWRATG
ncbi:MAG TPA: GNAT family N-acetyltransferase [Actinomycetota bacterium]|nr:GNAT family N-acetyltransferase [Actinomycetota bacterium]